ncbi:MAG: hypothetical protein E2577_18815, partial [Starkeya sp.]|nr:hypothetical protein [Starkeya sp.]
MTHPDFNRFSPLRMADTGNGSGNTPIANVPEDQLILLPVRNLVLFPGVVMPVAVARPASIAAAQQAVREGRPVGILMQRDASVDEPGPTDLHRMGVIANILRYVTAPDGTHHLVCQGEQRFRVDTFVREKPFLRLDREDGFFEFDKEQCKELGASLHDQYVANTPFPHIVIDNFLDADILRRVAAEFPGREDGRFSDDFSKLKT